MARRRALHRSAPATPGAPGQVGTPGAEEAPKQQRLVVDGELAEQGSARTSGHSGGSGSPRAGFDSSRSASHSTFDGAMVAVLFNEEARLLSERTTTDLALARQQRIAAMREREASAFDSPMKNLFGVVVVPTLQVSKGLGQATLHVFKDVEQAGASLAAGQKELATRAIARGSEVVNGVGEAGSWQKVMQRGEELAREGMQAGGGLVTSTLTLSGIDKLGDIAKEVGDAGGSLAASSASLSMSFSSLTSAANLNLSRPFSAFTSSVRSLDPRNSPEARQNKSQCNAAGRDAYADHDSADAPHTRAVSGNLARSNGGGLEECTAVAAAFGKWREVAEGGRGGGWGSVVGDSTVDDGKGDSTVEEGEGGDSTLGSSMAEADVVLSRLAFDAWAELLPMRLGGCSREQGRACAPPPGYMGELAHSCDGFDCDASCDFGAGMPTRGV
ncbi:hypothetical protein T484DRAFT_1880285, partial [Baffinella frigidus]